METKVHCPKCGSDQITANQHGYSAGKAVAGAVLTGGVGLLAGMHGSKKIDITCLACGFKFKPGEGKVGTSSPSQQYIAPTKPVLDDIEKKKIEDKALYLLTNKSSMDAMKFYMDSTGMAVMNARDAISLLAERNDLIMPKYSTMKALKKGQEAEMKKTEKATSSGVNILIFVVIAVAVIVFAFVLRSCVS